MRIKLLIPSLFLISSILFSHKNGMSQSMSFERAPNWKDSLATALSHFQQGDTTTWLDYLIKHPSGDTLYNAAQLEIIKTYNQNHQYDKGFAAYEKYSKELSFSGQESKLYELFIIKSAMLIGAGKYVEAVSFIEEKLQQYPKNHILMYNLSVAYHNSKQYAKGVEILKTLIKMNPSYAHAHNRLAQIYALEGKTAQAMLCSMMALLLAPTDDIGYLLNLHKYATGMSAANPVGIEMGDEGVSFKRINLILQSFAGLEKGYKVSSDLDIPMVKQIHVLLEKLPHAKDESNFWQKNYLSIFQKIKDQGQFEALSYYLVQNSQNEKHKKVLKKKSDEISNFTTIASTMRDDLLLVTFDTLEGGQVKQDLFTYNDGYLRAVGAYKNGVTPVGPYRYYDHGGGLMSHGSYSSSGKRTGTWAWKHSNGNLSDKHTYEEGELVGEYYSYYPDGQLKKKVTVDRSNEKKEILKNYYPDGTLWTEKTFVNDTLQGEVREYYENGQVQYEYTYQDGDIQGELKEYFINGEVKTVAQYKEGLYDGAYTSYFISGQVYKQGTYSQGYAEGSWVVYYANGNKDFEGAYKQNGFIGNVIDYHSNGQISGEFRYEEGKLQGTQKYYAPDGVLSYEEKYKNGNLIGFKSYDKEGNILGEGAKNTGVFTYTSHRYNGVKVTEGNYNVKGGKEGEWKYYTANGAIDAIEHFEDGVLQGSYTSFYPNGAKKKQSYYEDGQLEGKYVIYRPTGAIKEEGYYERDQLTGPYRFYYANGSLLTEAYYLNGEKNGWQIQYGIEGKKTRKEWLNDGEMTCQLLLDSTETVFQELTFSDSDTLKKLLYPNGAIESLIPYKNGEINGLRESYYPNGKLKSRYNISTGYMHGAYKSYHPNGNLKKEGEYAAGNIVGVWKYYHTDGYLTDKQSFVNGERVHFESFNEEGKTTYEVNYLDEQKHGKVYYYSDLGELQHIRYYDRGVIIGYAYLNAEGNEVPMIAIEKETGTVKSYYQNGQLSRAYSLEKGWFQGEYKRFSSKGVCISIDTYVDNEIHGKSSEYFNNGKLKNEEYRIHGNLHGEQRYYHENGQLRLINHFIHGDQNGKEEVFDMEGKLLETRVYYDDELIDQQ